MQLVSKVAGSGSAKGAKWALLSAGWGALTLAGALTLPLYSEGGTVTVGGRTTSTTSSATLFTVNGFVVIIDLAVPLLLSLISYASVRLASDGNYKLSRPVLLTCVVLVWLETALGAMSIGVFVLPTAILLTLGFLKSRRHPMI